MRLLFVDEELPYPLNSGKRIRTYNLIKHLRSHHQIGYVYYENPQDPANGADSMLETLTLFPVSARKNQGFNRYLLGVQNLFSHLPYSVGTHVTARFQSAVEQAVATFEPDLLVAEWTPYCAFLRGPVAVPYVVATHNVEARILRRHAEVKSGIASWYFQSQARRMERFEADALQHASAYTAVSESDLTELEKLAPGRPSTVIDNGVDLELFTPGAHRTEPPVKLTFVGSMDWMPNIDAVEYFAQDILPLIRRQLPNCEIMIIGRNPPAAIVELANSQSNFAVTGTVDDIRPYLQGTTINIVPLRVGGGSRLKIVESLACALPVVSTSVGAEGLQLQAGSHLELADSPEDFANAVCKLVADPTAASAMAARGRQAVAESYGWPGIGQRYEAFLQDVLAQHPAGSAV